MEQVSMKHVSTGAPERRMDGSYGIRDGTEQMAKSIPFNMMEKSSCWTSYGRSLLVQRPVMFFVEQEWRVCFLNMKTCLPVEQVMAPVMAFSDGRQWLPVQLKRQVFLFNRGDGKSLSHSSPGGLPKLEMFHTSARGGCICVCHAGLKQMGVQFSSPAAWFTATPIHMFCVLCICSVFNYVLLV